MSLLRAIAIVLLLAMCLPVLGITSSPTATSVQTTPAVVSLPAAASLANPAAVAATTAAFARPMPVAAAPAPAAKPAAVTTGSPSSVKATPGAVASAHPTAAAKPANPRTEHAALTPQQPAAPQRTTARTPPPPAPAPAQHAIPPAAKPQPRTTTTDEPRAPKAYVNTRSHWLPKAPTSSRDAARAPSRDRKDTQTSSSIQRDRTAPPPPPDRYASRPDYRDDDRRYTSSSRTASRYDDVRDDRRSYSSNAPRDAAARTGYRQSQDHGRRDSQTRVSESRRKALLREYKETARRQSEIERQLGGSYSGRASAKRDRYSEASSGRQ